MYPCGTKEIYHVHPDITIDDETSDGDIINMFDKADNGIYLRVEASEEQKRMFSNWIEILETHSERVF